MSGRKKSTKKEQALQAAVMLALVLLPVTVWMVVTLFVQPAVFYCGFSLFGWAGTLLLGFGSGVLWLYATDDGERIVSQFRTGIICAVAGVVLTAMSAVLIYHPAVNRAVDEDMAAFHFSNILFTLVLGWVYMRFRIALEDRLREQRISKTRINKLKRGWKNKLLYQALHQERGLGVAYYINMVSLIMFAVTLTYTVLLGWCRPLGLISGVLVLMQSVTGVADMLYEIRWSSRKRTFRLIWLSIVLMTAAAEVVMLRKIILGMPISA